jgi:hypothetical protein
VQLCRINLAVCALDLAGYDFDLIFIGLLNPLSSILTDLIVPKGLAGPPMCFSIAIKLIELSRQIADPLLLYELRSWMNYKLLIDKGFLAAFDGVDHACNWEEQAKQNPKESWLESGSVYGYRKVSDDLRELGEQCGINRVHRLMRSAAIRSQTGYAKRKYKRGGAPSLVAPNHLQRRFDVQEPNRVWVTDITYIRTYEGRLYLAVVLDLFSRQVVGWSMSSRIDRELAMNALLMAVWRRQPKNTVMVHSDSKNVVASLTCAV